MGGSGRSSRCLCSVAPGAERGRVGRGPCRYTIHCPPTAQRALPTLACRAKGIQNTVQVNTRVSPERLMQQLAAAKAEIEQLRQQLGKGAAAAAAAGESAAAPLEPSAAEEGGDEGAAAGSGGCTRCCACGGEGAAAAGEAQQLQVLDVARQLALASQQQQAWRGKQAVAGALSVAIPMLVWLVEDFWCQSAAALAVR